jgi:amino acid adenylation domain-containing protein
MDTNTYPDVTGLSAERLELLTYLLEEEGIELPQTHTIAPRGNLDELPLSFAQRRLWFLAQLEPESPVYNIPAAYRLSGTLNVTALERSLSEIVRRHDTLRTTFHARDGQPFQLVSPHRPLVLPVDDLRGLPDADKETRAMQLATEDAHRPFDLAQGPLFRATLVRLTAEESVFLVNMHHIVSDAWSMGVFFRELSTLYVAFSTGKPSPLRELPIQYADFSVWQRQWLQGEVLERQLSYWKQQLDGSPSMLELPTDRPRPAVQTYRGAKHSLVLPKTLSSSLKALSQREGVTLFTVLLTAFQILLNRYTGQEDITVGSPIAGRNWVETEGLIGFFVNTLVLRTDLSGNPTFRELLHRVREVALASYAHQDLPFEKLVEELQPQRSLSHSLLFQVMFALQNVPRQPLELPGLTVSPLEGEGATAKFDLSVLISEDGDVLRGTVNYSTDLFDADTIARFVGHFQGMLGGIVADPDAPISYLPLLTHPEMQQLLVAWNQTHTNYAKDSCLHELFEAQVYRTPDAVAVVFEDKQLTYREINTRANRLAYHLQTLGVRREVLVGLCMERSLEMVIGLLGVLKAGGGYVPLDPAYPAERLAFMLADAEAPFLLTQKGLLPRLPDHGIEVICVDTDSASIARESGENIARCATAENLAYVIYTSGSTGGPKGVMMSHRAICNHLHWRQETFPLNESDGFLQKASTAFDISVWEIFAPLIAGARLVLARPEGEKDPSYLVRLIAEQNITVAHFGPPLLQAFLAEPNLELCNALKHVFCGGEALSVALMEQVFSRLNAELYHQYGPTETCIDVTVWTCHPAHETARVPIGRPIANAQVYILDRHGQPVPTGVLGELYIGGVGLARGYLKRPELTAEKFLPNPFSQEPGGHLYKTGDLARYLRDGNIEFLGRIDDQVKIRGFRIELGEIEAVLGAHPAVREAVVLAREDIPGERRLVAYVVANQQPGPSINELRRFLQAKLPEYMLPAAFVGMDALPLTPNGKVDRRALPAPEGLRPELEANYVAPRTEVERTIATVWQQVLLTEKVGLYDNFFDLGGHSLLLIQVHSKLQEFFGKDISVLDMFKYPTIEVLTKYLGPKKAETARSRQGDDPIEKLNAGKDRLQQLYQRSRRIGEKG